MGDISVKDRDVGQEKDEGEFRVGMVRYHAAHVSTFFSAFDRFWWWDLGGGDID
jgi:hypothetical protein